MPLNVSFVNAFVNYRMFDANSIWIVHRIYWIVYYNVAVAVSQFDGLTFNPVDGLASHNW
jgi:hypothetical protein